MVALVRLTIDIYQVWISKFYSSGSGVFGVLRAFSFNYFQFATFEFLDAFFGSATYAAAYIIGNKSHKNSNSLKFHLLFHSGLELVTPRLRTISGTILNCFYALGGIYLGLIAMWFRNYKSLLLITYIPSFIVLTYTWLLPQSKCNLNWRDFEKKFPFKIWIYEKGVRWLLSKGRHDDAKTILRKACKLNGTEMSAQTLNSLEEKIQMQNSNKSHSTERKSEKISTRAVLQIVNLSYCWFATIFVYYGLNLNSVYLEYWDKHINFIVS